MPRPEAVEQYAEYCVSKAKEANPNLSEEELCEITANAYMDVMLEFVTIDEVMALASEILL